MTSAWNSPARFLFIACATVVLIGVLIWIRLGFQGADVRTAIRLVEEARLPDGLTLGQRLDEVLPSPTRLCEARTLSEMYGHMEVICRDTRDPDKKLSWRVNVLDGMVQPADDVTRQWGKGFDPWMNRK